MKVKEGNGRHSILKRGERFAELKELLIDDFNQAFSIDTALPVSRRGIRFLVDMYYSIQEFRKATENQVRSAGVEPGLFLQYVEDQMERMEEMALWGLKVWAEKDPCSKFALQVIGIGPVIAAGLGAAIDMDVATNPSKIWALCGYDPSRTWLGKEKGRALAKTILGSSKRVEAQHLAAAAKATNLKAENLKAQLKNLGESTAGNFAKLLARRPWSARLHTLCWKIGDGFKKQSGNEKSFYGALYQKFKLEEIEWNDGGRHAERAREFLGMKSKWSPTQKAAYKKGKLSDGHIDLRAMRRVVKVFLVNWWQAAYEAHYKKVAPRPYVEAKLGHSDIVDWRQVLAFEKGDE